MGDGWDDSFDSTTGSQIFCYILWSLEWVAVCVCEYKQTCQDVHALLITPYLIVQLIHFSCGKKGREIKCEGVSEREVMRRGQKNNV